MIDMISVCMATYNGEKFIKEQIDSILLNMNDNDELVISDDGSNDKTLAIIKQYNDSRIKLVDGPRKGVKKNFENAIQYATGEYIFLADQDDIWKNDKVKTVLKYFYENLDTLLVIHDAEVFNSSTKEIIYDSFFKFRNSKSGLLNNFIKNSYIGCCMAFNAELKEKIIPIPEDIDMHDQWIGLIVEIERGKPLFIKEKLLKYRRHGNNVSQMKHYGIKKMILNRLYLFKNLVLWRKNEKKS